MVLPRSIAWLAVATHSSVKWQRFRFLDEYHDDDLLTPHSDGLLVERTTQDKSKTATVVQVKIPLLGLNLKSNLDIWQICDTYHSKGSNKYKKHYI